MKYEAMNAKSAGDKLQALIDSGDYIAEIKLDGYRAICEHGVFYSRLGNVLDVPLQLPKNMVLDGELIIRGGRSDDVNHALGANGDKSKLVYVVFDIIELDGKDLTGLTWRERRLILQGFSARLFDLRRISYSKIYDNVMYALEVAESQDAEGIMLKNVNAAYQQGKRPENTWYKVKKQDTADVIITGFTEGNGKYAGLIGSIEFDGGRCSGMDDETRRAISENQQAYIGKVIEIEYMERTKAGKYRHPRFIRFRDDKTTGD